MEHVTANLTTRGMNESKIHQVCASKDFSVDISWEYSLAQYIYWCSSKSLLHAENRGHITHEAIHEKKKLKKKCSLHLNKSNYLSAYFWYFLISFHVLKARRQFSVSIPSSSKPPRHAPWRRRFVPSRYRCRALTLDHGHLSNPPTVYIVNVGIYSM